MKTCPKCGKTYEDTNTLCPADGTVLTKPTDLSGTTLAGKYRIDERISEGGMGTVYRATHILMEKTVAIKVLNPSLAADDKIVARFSREARAASRISHPHALNVTDFGEAENGVVFLVMEYLRGRTLKEVVRGGDLMPLPRVVEIIRQVCGALEAAHAEGVVHRDLKSDNIMLEEVGEGQDWAKVLDFGIAKIKEPARGVDAELTAPNLIIGTPQYMSPEQCSQASEIDSRSDIYSLGIILYEMLTGHVPFTGDSPTVIMMKHLQEPPPSVLEERKDLPPSIGRVVARALAKRPEDRYQTASQLSEALALAATDEVAAPSATATGPSASDRATKRIIVPTSAGASHSTANEEHNEATVVRERVRTDEVERFDSYADAPASSGSNIWRIVIPALVLLIIFIGVFYAVQRNSGQGAGSNQNAPLVSDPNSQPVQPVPPASGAGEQDVAPGTGAAASPSPETTTQGVVTPPAAGGEVIAPILLPSPAGGNANRNDNRQQNSNSGEQEEPPAPSPSAPANTNQRRTPPPAQESPEVLVPQRTPSPTPKKEATPAPTPPPPASDAPALLPSGSNA